MESLEERLKKTECHFNWNLLELGKTRGACVISKIQEKIEKISGKYEVWHLVLTCSYEEFDSNPEESFSTVESVIRNLLAAEDVDSCKYLSAYLHIAYSLKAYMLLKTGKEDKLVREGFMDEMKLVEDMSDVERSGLLFIKAHIFGCYGPDGFVEKIQLLGEALALNPNEIEWKLSLIAVKAKKRHIDHCDISWDVVEEPVNILEDLLNNCKLTPEQVVKCKHFLAVAYRDYMRFKNWRDPQIRECSEQVRALCEEIGDKTNDTTILTFCVRFYLVTKERKAIQMMDELLEKFPTDVLVNETAAKKFRGDRKMVLAAKHAQFAMDGGSYWSAWILLRCKFKLNEEFDDVKFIDHILSKFPLFKKLTLVHACIFYFHKKGDNVKGLQFIEKLLDEDPKYEYLKGFYCYWIHSRVCLLEVAHDRVDEALKKPDSSSDQLMLSRIKTKIEQCPGEWKGRQQGQKSMDSWRNHDWKRDSRRAAGSQQGLTQNWRQGPRSSDLQDPPATYGWRQTHQTSQQNDLRGWRQTQRNKNSEGPQERQPQLSWRHRENKFGAFVKMPE